MFCPVLAGISLLRITYFIHNEQQLKMIKRIRGITTLLWCTEVFLKMLKNCSSCQVISIFPLPAKILICQYSGQLSTGQLSPLYTSEKSAVGNISEADTGDEHIAEDSAAFVGTKGKI